jgi:hypothetical protein
VQRLERWKYEFVSAGTDEMARRKDGGRSSMRAKRWESIQQWAVFMILLAAVIAAVVYLRTSSEVPLE